MKSYIDISWPITPEMTSYKDSKPVTITHNKTMEKDGAEDSTITINLHTGTHVDAPSHFVAGGKTIDQIRLEDMSGPCRVLDLTHVTEKITAADLVPHDLQEGERILLKTSNSGRGSEDSFDYNFVYVAADAAALIAKSGVRLAGIDALGIERNQPSHETHTALFKGGVIIVEGLRLGDVAPGCYELTLMPLALVAVQAAPARALLLPQRLC